MKRESDIEIEVKLQMLCREPTNIRTYKYSREVMMGGNDTINQRSGNNNNMHITEIDKPRHLNKEINIENNMNNGKIMNLPIIFWKKN